MIALYSRFRRSWAYRPEPVKHWADPEAKAAWARLHAISPKLFPEWGAEGKILRVDWVELGWHDPVRATAEVFHLLRRLRLGWVWDEKRGELAVQDAQGSYGYHRGLPPAADARALLLESLADLLTDWPELGNPDLWTGGNPPRRPSIVHGPDGLEMDGELILPAEPPRDDTAWNAAAADCTATIAAAVKKLSEVK